MLKCSRRRSSDLLTPHLFVFSVWAGMHANIYRTPIKSDPKSIAHPNHVCRLRFTRSRKTRRAGGVSGPGAARRYRPSHFVWRACSRREDNVRRMRDVFGLQCHFPSVERREYETRGDLKKKKNLYFIYSSKPARRFTPSAPESERTSQITGDPPPLLCNLEYLNPPPPIFLLFLLFRFHQRLPSEWNCPSLSAHSP